MAKSLRSKWKRKMRAEKRVRYAVKEKARLVKMLGDFEKSRQEAAVADQDNPMEADGVLGAEKGLRDEGHSSDPPFIASLVCR